MLRAALVAGVQGLRGRHRRCARARADRSRAGAARAARAAHGPRIADEGARRPEFYDRPVLEVARELIGCIVEHRRRRGRDRRDRGLPRERARLPRVRRAHAAHAHAVRRARARLRVSLLRHPRAPERRLRAGGRRRGGADPRARAARGDRGDARARAAGEREQELCSGPGKLTAGARASSSARTTPASRRAGRDPPARRRWREPSGRGGPAHRDHQGRRAALALLRRGQPPRLAPAASGAEPPLGAAVPPLAPGRFACRGWRRRSAGLGAGVGRFGGLRAAGRRRSAAGAPRLWRGGAPRRLACEGDSARGRGRARRVPGRLVRPAPWWARRGLRRSCLVGVRGCSARSFSTRSAESMKLCQISAGKVPPSTGCRRTRWSSGPGCRDSRPTRRPCTCCPSPRTRRRRSWRSCRSCRRRTGRSRPRVAVPYWSTVSSIEVSVSATPAGSTRVASTCVDVAVVPVGERARRRRRLPGCPRAAQSCDQRAADALAAVGDGLVGVGHVQRRDADLQPADRHRRVGRDRRGDAHAVGEAGDPVGAHLQARLRRRSSCRSRPSRR